MFFDAQIYMPNGSTEDQRQGKRVISNWDKNCPYWDKIALFETKIVLFETKIVIFETTIFLFETKSSLLGQKLKKGKAIISQNGGYASPKKFE